MDERRREPTHALTVDHLLARLETLERAFADLQRAYAELHATTRARHRAPLVDGLLADGPAPWPAAQRAEAGRRDTVRRTTAGGSPGTSDVRPYSKAQMKPTWSTATSM